MEKEKIATPNYCFANVGGRRLRVELPMSQETWENLARAQSGIKTEMTEQMHDVNPKEIPIRQWRKFYAMVTPSNN